MSSKVAKSRTSKRKRQSSESSNEAVNEPQMAKTPNKAELVVYATDLGNQKAQSDNFPERDGPTYG